MGPLVLLLLVVLAAAMPDFAPAFLSIDRHPPDLWLLATAYLAFRARGYRAVGWAVVVGFLRDAASLDPLGTHAFVLGVVAFVFCEGRRDPGRLDATLRLLLTGLASVLASWVWLLRVLPYSSDTVTLPAFLDAFPTALWTVLAAAFLFPLLDRTGVLDDLCGRPRALSA